jgi:hypothetical protein
MPRGFSPRRTSGGGRWCFCNTVDDAVAIIVSSSLRSLDAIALLVLGAWSMVAALVSDGSSLAVVLEVVVEVVVVVAVDLVIIFPRPPLLLLVVLRSSSCSMLNNEDRLLFLVAVVLVVVVLVVVDRGGGMIISSASSFSKRSFSSPTTTTAPPSMTSSLLDADDDLVILPDRLLSRPPMRMLLVSPAEAGAATPSDKIEVVGEDAVERSRVESLPEEEDDGAVVVVVKGAVAAAVAAAAPTTTTTPPPRRPRRAVREPDAKDDSMESSVPDAPAPVAAVMSESLPAIIIICVQVYLRLYIDDEVVGGDGMAWAAACGVVVVASYPRRIDK